MKLVHQQQTKDTCVSACLAMLLNIPLDQVVSEFHAGYMARDTEPEDFLRRHGVKVRDLLTSERGMVEGGLYILTVPSLHFPGKNHCILADARDGFTLLDPQQGRPGSKYYVWKKDDELQENEVNLDGYCLDFDVTLEED